MAHLLTEETSLTRKRKAVLSETTWLNRLVKIEAGLAVVLTLGGLVVFVWKGSGVLLGFGIVAAVFWLAHALRIKENRKEERRVQSGLKGEADVTRRLAEALDNSHYILNDFVVPVGRQTAQIDHLVISPKALFVIETKNWSGHIEGDENETTWTRTRRPGEPPDTVSNPIRQLRRQIDMLRNKLEKSGIDWPDIVGMVVFTSPRTTHYIHPSTVPVLSPDEAASGIARYQAKRVYRQEEIDAVVNLLMRSS